MWKLVFANILQRRTRTLVSLIAVALGVLMILMSTGLSYGQLNDLANRARRIGGDFLLQPSGGSLFFGLNSGTLEADLKGIIEQTPGVSAVTPVLVKFISDGFFSLYGVEPDSFRQVSGGPRLVEGRMVESGNEVVVDTIFAPMKNLEIGSTVTVLGQDFRVVGIYEAGVAARMMIPHPTLQQLNGTPTKTSMFFIRIADGRTVDEVEVELKKTFGAYKLTRTEDLEKILIDSTPAFQQFLTTMVAISVSISFLVTLLTMYSTIVERTREIGILKSLGASKSFIVQLVLRESVVICGVGVGLGFLATTIALGMLTSAYPNIPVDVRPGWRISAVLIAIIGGLLGAFYPAVRAARLDPVKALGYE